jgi:hypothetical protein
MYCSVKNIFNSVGAMFEEANLYAEVQGEWLRMHYEAFIKFY